MDVESLLRTALFWIVIAPALTLVLELGHACGGLLTTPGTITASLGSSRPAHDLRLGRLRIELRPLTGIVGFCRREFPAPSWRAEVFFFALGPLASLMMAGLGFWLMQADLAGEWVYRSVMIGALMQAFFTIIPVTYPSWLGGYAGYGSDGAMILRSIRTRQPLTPSAPTSQHS